MIISKEESTWTLAIDQAYVVDAHCVNITRIPDVKVRRKKVKSVNRLDMT